MDHNGFLGSADGPSPFGDTAEARPLGIEYHGGGAAALHTNQMNQLRMDQLTSQLDMMSFGGGGVGAGNNPFGQQHLQQQQLQAQQGIFQVRNATFTCYVAGISKDLISAHGRPERDCDAAAAPPHRPCLRLDGLAHDRGLRRSVRVRTAAIPATATSAAVSGFNASSASVAAFPVAATPVSLLGAAGLVLAVGRQT